MKASIKIEKVSNGYIINVNGVKSVAKDLDGIKEQMGELFKDFAVKAGDNINYYSLELICINDLKDGKKNI